MTVIVYRDGIMAADTGSFMGDIIIATDAKKIIKTPAGHLVGCAGKMSEITRFHGWANDGFRPADRPEGFSDFGALTVAPDGTITKYSDACWPYLWSGDWAIEGCAEEFCAGALVQGASAAEVVALAIKHCAWAAGSVAIERLVEELPADDREDVSPVSLHDRLRPAAAPTPRQAVGWGAS